MIVYVIIGIVTFLAIAGLFLIDNAFDRIFGWLFRKAGLQSGNGPLMVRSKVQGEQVLSQGEMGLLRLQALAERVRCGHALTLEEGRLLETHGRRGEWIADGGGDDLVQRLYDGRMRRQAPVRPPSARKPPSAAVVARAARRWTRVLSSATHTRDGSRFHPVAAAAV